jgi:anti-sigma regulatory factor (Ser/Thr protein kinase)
VKNNSLTVSVIVRKIGSQGAEVIGTGANVRAARRAVLEAFKASGMPASRAALVAIILANGVEFARSYGYSLRTALAVLKDRGPTTRSIQKNLNLPR